MKPIHALAILGALAAGPALAQEYPSGSPSQQPSSGAPAAIQGSNQAVEADFLAQIQQQLQLQGLYDGPIDGVYGQQTQSALAQWQSQQGIEPTGQLNAQTLAAMDVDALATQQAEVPQESQSQPRTQSRTQPLEQQSEDQQASQPEEQSSDLETLREEHMSAPNIEGEATPERPDTGVPAPGRTPGGLESPQNR